MKTTLVITLIILSMVSMMKADVESYCLDGGRHDVELVRGGPWPFIKLPRELGDDEDCGYSFDVERLDDESSFCLCFDDARQHYTGMVYVDREGYVNVLQPKGYERTKMVVEPRRSYHFSVSLSRDNDSVSVEVRGLGSYQGRAMFQSHLGYFRFSPQAPTGTRNAISNFECHRLPRRIINRENGALGAVVELSATGEKLKEITDGDCSTLALLPEKSELFFHLPRRIDITAVQIYGGNPANAGYPSGACSPCSYVVEGLSNGAWCQLCAAEEAQDVAAVPALRAEERFIKHEFAPVTVDAVRIRLTKSHDTSRRLTGPVREDQRNVFLREVELFSTRLLERRLPLAELVQMEYRLPFYRNASQATLTFIVAEHPQAPRQGMLEIYSPKGELVNQQVIALASGRSEITVGRLGDLPAGRYLTVFKTHAGEIKRLLRLERVPEVKPPQEPLSMSGKTMFFTPDDYVLSTCENLSVEVFPVQVRELARTPDDQHLILTGFDFYQTQDGRCCLRVNDHAFRVGMFSETQHQRTLVAEKVNGLYAEVDEVPQAGWRPHPAEPFVPAAFPKPPKGTKFELYDISKHGPMPLGNLSYVYSYQPEDYGCVKAKARSYWVTGRTTDGVWVMMRDRHLFIDVNRYGEDTFDDGFMTNDNFGGMWLSPDGRECLWAQGQTVHRAAPYAIPYDNLQTGMRFLTVYSTTDGVNWRYRHCMAVPDEQDSPGAQHYGAMLLPVARGDITLSYLYDYDGDAQQIYPELIYSRDGIHFHRFPGHRPLVRSTTPGEWYFGHLFLSPCYVADGHDYVQLASYCTPLPHFSAEPLMGHSKLAEVTAEDYQRRFTDRDLASRWPYFERNGGYEGLATMARKAYYAAGSMRFRQDGWFGLQAGDKAGLFTTRRLYGGRRLLVNAEIAGDLSLELLDAEGHVLKKALLDGNDTMLFAFDLPDGEYRIRGTMRNTRLYCLYFTK